MVGKSHSIARMPIVWISKFNVESSVTRSFQSLRLDSLRGNPSSKTSAFGRLATINWIFSITISRVHSEGTNLPSFISSSMARERSLSYPSWARSNSPAAIWTAPSSCPKRLHSVDLPDPGQPRTNKTWQDWIDIGKLDQSPCRSNQLKNWLQKKQGTAGARTQNRRS